MAMYRDKINDLFAMMFALRRLIHRNNTASVDAYLGVAWSQVARICESFAPKSTFDTFLDATFQTYVDGEERTIMEKLDAFRYHVDALDTLALITGQGRIEKVRA